jgi:hypothetical protein
MKHYSSLVSIRYQAESEASKIMGVELLESNKLSTFCQIHANDFRGLTLVFEEYAPIKPSKHLIQFHAANQQERL